MNLQFLKRDVRRFMCSAFIAGCAVLEAHAGDHHALTLVGTVSIPGDSVDLSGDSQLLQNGEPRNRLGGFSALEYSGRGTQFVCLSDRGPDDGAVDYHCRVQWLDLDFSSLPASNINYAVAQTTLLKDSEGRRFSGSSAAIKPTEQTGHRLDPEGLRLAADGSMFVSDEYGPHVIQFSADGRELKRYQLPDHWLVATPDADKKQENSLNATGRASNRGLECLAISQDGDFLVALMQGPLLQDGQRTADGIVVGRNCRLAKIDLATAKVNEFVYQMDSTEHGNSEIAAIGPDEYLVLERDSLPGESARYRRLIRVNVSRATEISGVEKLPVNELPAEITPVERTVYLDFLDPQWNLAGAAMPEKIEGLTFGPAMADGRRTLLVGTDNDFESAAASLIWVFAIND